MLKIVVCGKNVVKRMNGWLLIKKHRFLNLIYFINTKINSVYLHFLLYTTIKSNALKSGTNRDFLTWSMSRSCRLIKNKQLFRNFCCHTLLTLFQQMSCTFHHSKQTGLWKKCTGIKLTLSHFDKRTKWSLAEFKLKLWKRTLGLCLWVMVWRGAV